MTKQFSTFYLQNLMFGVESQNIQEVLRTVELTEVPLAPKAIAGLMNLRGQIVAALDLRQRLELDDRAESPPADRSRHSNRGRIGGFAGGWNRGCDGRR